MVKELAKRHGGIIKRISPDIVHSINPVTEYYTMITTCLPVDGDISGELDIIKGTVAMPV